MQLSRRNHIDESNTIPKELAWFIRMIRSVTLNFKSIHSYTVGFALLFNRYRETINNVLQTNQPFQSHLKRRHCIFNILQCVDDFNLQRISPISNSSSTPHGVDPLL